MERSGYQVLTTGNGEHALEIIAQEHPDIVILDVLMPRLDGRDVLRRLRQSGDWTPVILLTKINTTAEEEAIALVCAASTPERQITLNVQQTPWPVTAVRRDRDLLMLAFSNLLDNALKFSQTGDRVEIRASEDGRMAIVEIADTGAGIPADELSQIFEELYRGRNARGIPGSGLGLKIVERIIFLHQGSLQVRSKPEQGSVFTIRLPLVESLPTGHSPDIFYGGFSTVHFLIL
jgi:signal transduction histidine kinase